MHFSRVVFVIFMLASPHAWGETLKIAYHRDLGTPSGQALSFFAAEMDACTGGEVTVDLFPNGVLARSSEAAIRVAEGNFEMALVPASGMQFVNPTFGILSAPLMFNNRRHWVAALNGDAAEALNDLAASRGLRSLGFAGGEQFGILSTSPVLSVADLKGRSIRSLGRSVSVLASLGAAPKLITFAEVPLALQQGAVESAELTPAAAQRIKADQVANNYTRTNHRILTELFVINADLFESLNEEAKDCVISKAAEAMEVARNLVVEEENAALAAFAGQGLKISELTDRSEMFERASGARNEIVADLKAGLLFDLITASATCPTGCTTNDCGSSTCQMCSFCE